MPANFHKSLELFSLHRAIAVGSDCVIVVEGFLDCMRVFDAKKLELAGGAEAFTKLASDAKAGVTTAVERLGEVQGIAAQASFRAIAILPAILLVVFGAIWLYDRSKGGYKAVKLHD